MNYYIINELLLTNPTGMMNDNIRELVDVQYQRFFRDSLGML